MKKFFFLSLVLIYTVVAVQAQSPVISNKRFSLGSYGRAGIARADKVGYPRSLNLNGMGSIGGRMEEGDYFELAAALHFAPVSGASDTTNINVQARFSFYTTQGQIIGNVTSNSYGGITVALPELFAEARNIMGSPWSVWVGPVFFAAKTFISLIIFILTITARRDLVYSARTHNSPSCFPHRLIPPLQYLLTSM